MWEFAKMGDSSGRSHASYRDFTMAQMSEVARPERSTGWSVKRTGHQRTVTGRGATGKFLTMVPWRYAVTLHGKPVSQGIVVDERITYKDGKDVDSQGPDVAHTTDRGGHVSDNWKIVFTSRRGEVRVEQKLIIGRGETAVSGIWAAIVRANGSVNPIGGDTLDLQ